MIVGIQSELLKIQSLGLLDRLLSDKTTKTNIIWATDAYKDKGPRYQRDHEITADLITGENSSIIKNRARKALEHQSERTKAHAEVFTPLWICQMMNDHADEVWFKRKEVFFKDEQPTEAVVFPKKKTWKHYVDARRLEITCGEGPYLVSRYDASTGESIPIEARVGILDRKLRVVNENAADEAEWLKWAIRAFQATYGYEFQGDNLLIARLNLLMTFEEYLQERWKRKPTPKEYQTIANIVAWNIWQMDGLTGTIPYCKGEEDNHQLSLFELYGLADDAEERDTQPVCRIYDWRRDNSREFIHSNEGVIGNMKFDFIIGNPPYQEEYEGESSGANSIYNKFMDATFEMSDRVELITPGRFLFNAGSTPKAWNAKMLADAHFKVLHYESVASNIFPNVIITGGVAITYRDSSKYFGAIETFTPFEPLNTILKKVKGSKGFSSLESIAVTSFAYHFTDAMHNDYPDAKGLMSKGHAYDLKSNCFKTLSHIFTTVKQADSDACILGRDDSGRATRYIKRDYINNVANFDGYKVFLSKADGASGTIGNPIPARIVGTSALGYPQMGSTESFLSIGNFQTLVEAENLTKYIKTRFARATLGILKVTQDITPSKWKYVPLQDFTPDSDIDWSVSVAEIDRQLYAKYGLDESEISFIETHVKEME